MSHLDDGLLTALLDNELEEAERRYAETHLSECGECRRLLEEIKAFATEADGLVAAVELPPKRTPESIPVPARAGPPANLSPTGRRDVGRPLPWRTLAWAASVVLAAGLGWKASDLHYGSRGPDLGDRSTETDRLAPAVEEPKPAGPAPARAPVPPNSTGLARKESGQTKPTELEERANNAPASRPATPPPEARDEAARTAQQLQSRSDQADLRGFADAAASTTGGVAAKALVGPRREAGFRQVDMEEAVRRLAGSIRLVDGLQPERILSARHHVKWVPIPPPTSSGWCTRILPVANSGSTSSGRASRRWDSEQGTAWVCWPGTPSSPAARGDRRASAG